MQIDEKCQKGTVTDTSEQVQEHTPPEVTTVYLKEKLKFGVNPLFYVSFSL